MKDDIRIERMARLEIANEMIRVIASCGRRFFDYTKHGGKVSVLEMDRNGRIWLVDGWCQNRIYTHAPPNHWRHFTGGGTLQNVISRLRDFVMRGDRVPAVFGPWPSWVCGGDLWGYGEDMEIVRAAAERLGLHEVKSESKRQA